MRLIAAAVVAFVVCSARSEALAYPEFQFSTGNSRCLQCHFSPTGGGLLNAYGRDEAASTISGDGDGRFLHGMLELPRFLNLGGDLRLGGFVSLVRGGRELAAFPMQGDLYARVGHNRWSVSATVGVLATVRQPKPISERIGAREYYAMYQPRSKRWYVRAGRFFPTSGLRGPDHTAFVRRFTGLYLLEEKHVLAAGLRRGTNEFHAALITPIELAPMVGKTGPGAALYWEQLVADQTASVSLAVRAIAADDGLDGWLVSSWKQWFESSRLQLMAELDLGILDVPGDGVVSRAVALTSLYWRPAGSLGGAVSAHYADLNLRYLGQERIAIDLSARYFSYGHFEIAALIRAEQIVSDNAQALAMLQLHYFL